MRISEPSFTDSGIDATGKTENQTCTRVDGRSAPSTLSLLKSARAGGLGHGFPRVRYYDLTLGNPISHTHIDRDSRGGLEGCSPSISAQPNGQGMGCSRPMTRSSPWVAECP